MEILGLILAGGLSSRMGRDKATLDFCGHSLLENQLLKLQEHQLPVAISSNTSGHDDISCDVPILADPVNLKYGGPLAGIYAGLDYAHKKNYHHILTMPVDCPIVPDDFFDKMCQSPIEHDTLRIASTPSGLQPTFALWPTSLKDELLQFLVGSENKSIRSFAFAHNVFIVRFDNGYSDGAFFNVNTPDDYQYLQQNFEMKNETKA